MFFLLRHSFLNYLSGDSLPRNSPSGNALSQNSLFPVLCLGFSFFGSSSRMVLLWFSLSDFSCRCTLVGFFLLDSPCPIPLLELRFLRFFSGFSPGSPSRFLVPRFSFSHSPFQIPLLGCLFTIPFLEFLILRPIFTTFFLEFFSDYSSWDRLSRDSPSLDSLSLDSPSRTFSSQVHFSGYSFSPPLSRIFSGFAVWAVSI